MKFKNVILAVLLPIIIFPLAFGQAEVSKEAAELLNNSSPAAQVVGAGTVLKRVDDYAVYRAAGSNYVKAMVNAIPVSNAAKAAYATIASNASNAMTSLYATQAGWSLWSMSNSNSIWADGAGTFGSELPEYYLNLTNHTGLLPISQVWADGAWDFSGKKITNIVGLFSGASQLHISGDPGQNVLIGTNTGGAYMNIGSGLIDMYGNVSICTNAGSFTAGIQGSAMYFNGVINGANFGSIPLSIGGPAVNFNGIPITNIGSIELSSGGFMSNISTIYGVFKRGTTQGGAGAVSNEIWVDTDDDYTLKLGQ